MIKLNNQNTQSDVGMLRAVCRTMNGTYKSFSAYKTQHSKNIEKFNVPETLLPEVIKFKNLDIMNPKRSRYYLLTCLFKQLAVITRTVGIIRSNIKVSIQMTK